MGVKLNFRLKKCHDLYLLVQITKTTVTWKKCPNFFIQIVYPNQFNISAVNLKREKQIPEYIQVFYVP